jgi:hypothetical protein
VAHFDREFFNKIILKMAQKFFEKPPVKKDKAELERGYREVLTG